MQRLGRAAPAVLQLQRCLTTEALQRAQWPAGSVLATAASAGVDGAAAAGVAAPLWCRALSSQAALSQPLQPLQRAAHTAAGPDAIQHSSSSSSLHRHQLHHHQHHQQQQQRAYATEPPASVKSPLLAAEDEPSCPSTAAAGGGSGAGAASADSSSKQRIEGVCHRRNVKCGWKKIDFVLRMIRRSTVDDAMAQLAACPKRAAMFVRHALANARGNAIYAGGDPARLWVAEAFVTKGQYQKRLHIMSKGFNSLKQTRFSHLNVRVEQADDAFLAAAALRAPPRLVAPIMARMQQRSRMQRSSSLRWRRGAGGGGHGGDVAAAGGSAGEQQQQQQSA